MGRAHPPEDAVTEESPDEQQGAAAGQGEVAGALAQIDAEIAELTAMLNRHRTGDAGSDEAASEDEPPAAS
ncbi:MAG: hypothetical protein ACRDMV_11140 [Streptosporangiales bacterium]